MRDKSLIKAIQILGGYAATARLFGISREAVCQWRKCPPDRVRKLADATDGQVTAAQLRPDLYRGMEAAE